MTATPTQCSQGQCLVYRHLIKSKLDFPFLNLTFWDFGQDLDLGLRLVSISSNQISFLESASICPGYKNNWIIEMVVFNEQMKLPDPYFLLNR